MEYGFTLTSLMPILFHADDVEAADELNRWRRSAENKAVSVAGDDRSPAWTWQTYLYHDGEHLAIPQENIMACLCKAGAMIPMPKGKSTFKSASQSGLVILSEFCEFRSGGKQVAMTSIAAMGGLAFAEQAAGAKKLGFELKVKRATIGKSKHVRVRAMFRSWAVSGVIEVLDPLITAGVLAEMFDIGGRKVGILDWRPSSPKKPGPYGTFKSEVKPLAAAKKSA
jgi:hypothetical protein